MRHGVRWLLWSGGALFLFPALALASWGCIQLQEGLEEELVPQWDLPFSSDTSIESPEVQLRWMSLPPGDFHEKWHLLPQRRQLFAEGHYCSILRGTQLAQESCRGEFNAKGAEQALSLLALARGQDQKLVVEDRLSCLDALGRTAEADALLENASRLDSGTVWAPRRVQKLWERKMRAHLAQEGSDSLRAALLDTLRLNLLLRFGEKVGGVLDDSLRWDILEAHRLQKSPLPDWADGWMVERLEKGSLERRKAIWDWLEERGKAPGLNDSPSLQLIAAKHQQARGRIAETNLLLDNLEKQKLLPAEERALKKMRADILFRQKRWVDAAQLYAQLVEERPTGDPDAMLQLARSHRNRGSVQQADSIYALFRERYPTHSKTAEMHWTAATNAENAGRWSEAADAYRKIDNRFRNERRRPWVEFRVALIDFKREQYAESSLGFAKAAAETPHLWPHNGALLLHAESLRRLSAASEKGRSSDSLIVRAYQEAIADHPVGWYAHRARQLLQEHQLLPATEIPQLRLIDSLSDQAIALWLRKATNSRLSPTAPAIAAAELRELDLLLLFGEWKLAEEWTRERFKTSGEDPFLSFAAARLMMKRGALAEGYRESRRLVNRIDRRTLSVAPREVMQLFYPRPYWGWVQRVASENHLDPYFILALLRQESIFDDQIVSPVGAIGLGQIMPATGKMLARQVGVPYFETEMLRNPLLSIKFGGRYLGDLWKRWQDPRWVLANYNAGPAPTARWSKALSEKSWEFAAEEVSYWETRDYIKKVMGNWWTYRRVWGEE